MIKIDLKSSKGITLVTLIAGVVIMMIITSALIYNASAGSQTRMLNNMYNDTKLLQDKISLYDSEKGRLPVLTTAYTNADAIKNKNQNDNEVYYVIDLEAMENLTLSYGKEYFEYKQGNTGVTDLYIVNEQSHVVYYVAGIEFEGKTYHTVPTENSKIILPQWSNAYEQTSIYTDTQGNIARIPKGFQVSLTAGENKIEEGLVIRNATDLNEFVWIPVDQMEGGYQVKDWNKGLQATTYTEYYTAEGQSNAQTIEAIDKSVVQNRGFYISRYEVGTTLQREAEGEAKEKPVSRKTTQETTIYPYNWVTWNQSKTLAETLYTKETDGVDSKLINSKSWDCALKFIEKSDTAYPTDGTNKGWYENNSSQNGIKEPGKDMNEARSNKIKNIYDMGGNVWEWTADQTNTNTFSTRGGAYDLQATLYPAAYRNAQSPTNTSANLGFRIALYL